MIPMITCIRKGGTAAHSHKRQFTCTGTTKGANRRHRGVGQDRGRYTCIRDGGVGGVKEPSSFGVHTRKSPDRTSVAAH